jgi:hypothetical protein
MVAVKGPLRHAGKARKARRHAKVAALALIACLAVAGAIAIASTASARPATSTYDQPGHPTSARTASPCTPGQLREGAMAFHNRGAPG